MRYFLARALVTGLVMAVAVIVPAQAADAPAAKAADRAAMESIVHDYLMQHPEVIIQAVQSYQESIEAAKDKAAHEALAKNQAQLLNDPATQVAGNPAGDCPVVEFFDNQCPYCQANEPVLQALLKQDGRIKLVLKEFPILGPISTIAAKAALASVKQGKYAEFHAALLAHKGHYDKESIVDEIAKSVGLDLDRLHKDMEQPEVAKEIDRNLELGRALDISGTPGFVIGDQIVSGALSIDELKKSIADSCKLKG